MNTYAVTFEDDAPTLFVEAGQFYVSGGCLVFANKYGENLSSIAGGAWLAVVKQ